MSDDDEGEQLGMTPKDFAVGAGIAAYLITLLWSLSYLASGVLFGR